jgi:hypothetical protein
LKKARDKGLSFEMGSVCEIEDRGRMCDKAETASFGKERRKDGRKEGRKKGRKEFI